MKHYIGDGKITEEMTPSLPHLILSYSTQVDRHQDYKEKTCLPNPVNQMELVSLLFMDFPSRLPRRSSRLRRDFTTKTLTHGAHGFPQTRR